MKTRAEKIDRYLDGRMDAEEQAAFAREIAGDADVRSEVAAEQILRVQESVPFVPSANESTLPPVLHAALSSTGRSPAPTGAAPKPAGSFPAFPGWTIVPGLLLGTLAGIFIGMIVVGDRESHPPIDSRSPAPVLNVNPLPDRSVTPRASEGGERIANPSVSERTEGIVQGRAVKERSLTESANSTPPASHEALAEEITDERTDPIVDDNGGKEHEAEQLRAALEKRADQATIERQYDSLRLKLE